MSACCRGAASGREPRRPLQSVWKGAFWALPGTTLILLPKCPVCFAAYVALWTGVGLSIPAAAYLRWSLLFSSAATLLFLIARGLRRRRAAFNPFMKENVQCSTRS